MRRLLIGLVLIGLGAASGAGALWLHLRERIASGDAPAAEHAQAAPGDEPPRVTRTTEGEVTVHLDAEAQERAALRTEPLVAASHQPEIVAYGVLQEDPQLSFTLRAPVAGVVRAAADSAWPEIGQQLAARELMGRLEPRLTPTERLDLAARLTQARADVAAAEAALATARSSYEHKKKLNAENKAVSDRALEEAESKVKGEEVRLTAGTDMVRLIEAAQEIAGGATTFLELRAARAGEVVESTVQPGESVEPGQVLLRIADFGVLVARVEVPVGTRFDEAVATVRLTPVGSENLTFNALRIGLGLGATLADRGVVLLFRVLTCGQPLRPGAPVMAYLPVPGGRRAGVSVPRSAIVRFQGRAWVYVQIEEQSFVRREVAQAEPIDSGWFTSVGLAAGDRVVVEGVQVLLSEEQKSQIEQEQAAGE